MEYRPLGQTGVMVSPLCLGAMMFGAWGNPDHHDSADSGWVPPVLADPANRRSLMESTGER